MLNCKNVCKSEIEIKEEPISDYDKSAIVKIEPLNDYNEQDYLTTYEDHVKRETNDNVQALLKSEKDEDCKSNEEIHDDPLPCGSVTVVRKFKILHFIIYI